MDYLYGALSTAAFLFCLYGAYTLGKRSRKTVKARQTQEDEEAKRKAKKLHQDFQTLMNYDMTTAISGKKVT